MQTQICIGSQSILLQIDLKIQETKVENLVMRKKRKNERNCKKFKLN